MRTSDRQVIVPVKRWLLVVLAAVTMPLSAAEPKRMADLVVRIVGADSKSGTIRVALYDTEHDFQRVVARGMVLHAAIPRRELLFQGLKPGRYAVAAYHDVNGNGVLDKYLTGYPSEPFGFSRNPKVIFGPPEWDECVFLIARTTRRALVVITME